MPNSKIIIESYSSLSIGEGGEKEIDKQVLEHLSNRKDRKLMSKQDKLSIISASEAWKKSPFHDDQNIKDRTGIYFCVGILPFEDKHLQKIAKYSQEDEKFSYEKFSTDGFNSMNPLLTFKCLPNMPLFHISFNLGITGRYVMTYPGHLDFFEALNRAVDDLEDGIIDAAIVGAACDQQNILVQHHLNRSQEGLEKKASDCSATLVLSRRVPKAGDIFIENIDSSYMPADPFTNKTITEENDDYFYGSASLPTKIINSIESGDYSFQWKLGETKTSLKLGRCNE